MRSGSLVILLTLSSGVAWAGSPSFDCSEAKSAVEMIVCADGGLALRDTALAEVYAAKRKTLSPAEAKALAAEQRAWLKKRDGACPLPVAPATPDALALSDLWKAAPCLAKVYDDRLKALGGAVPDPGLPLASLPVHPLCLSAALPGFSGEEPPPVSLLACSQGNAHTPIEKANDYFSAEGTFWGPGWAWIGYHPVGSLPDGRILADVAYSGGGSGSFSDVVALTFTPGQGDTWLKAETVRNGGDRCNGGLEKVELVNGVLMVDVRVTPEALLQIMGVQAAQANHEQGVGLPDCAACCAGTATMRHPLSGGDETLVAITIDPDAASFITPPGETPAERCFLQEVAPRSQETRRLDPAQAFAVASQVDACLARRSP